MEKKIYCDASLCVACMGCEIACAVEHSKSKDLLKAVQEEPRPRSRKKVLTVGGKSMAVSCRHCEPAQCVIACMSGAMHKNEKGETVCDEEKCVGCSMCIMVCPFGIVMRQKDVILKCDLCPELENKYACVDACPTGALFIGTAEEFKKRMAKQKQG